MSERTEDLAAVIWKLATAAAVEQFGARVKALEDDVEELRDAIQPRPIEPQSLRA